MASCSNRTLDSLKTNITPWLVFGLIGILTVPPCAEAQALRLFMPGDGDKVLAQDCPHLMESFLKDLRNIVPDTSIIIDLPSKLNSRDNTETYQLRCRPEADQRSIEMQSIDKKTNYQFRFTKRAQGFEAMDWLAFQRRPKPDISLAPAERSASLPMSTDLPNEVQLTPPFYKKFWFWTLVGGAIGVGTGAYLYSQSHHQNRLNVEIR